MRNYRNNKQSFSLVEIVVAISIFLLIFTSVAFFAADTLRFTGNSEKRINATLQIQEFQSAIMLNKNDLWATIVNGTDTGDKSVTLVNNKYSIIDGSTEKNGITTKFTITKAYRDSSSNIVASGGVEDARSRIINLSSSWKDITGKDITVNSQIFVNDWNTSSLKHTTSADFAPGVFNSTGVDNSVGDGAVKLHQIIYPDWCNPSLALNQYDLPGNSVSKTVFALPGKAYLGTAGTSTTNAMTKLNISGVTPPTISLEGTFGGYAVNDIFIVGDYAYLATTDNNKEVVIVNISSYPYTEVGYFDATGTDDANSVYVQGTVGYVATARKVQSFNLTSNSGPRSKYGEITLANTPVFLQFDYVSQIIVRGNYIFAALENDWYEFAIGNVTNPSNMTFISQRSVNNLQTSDIYVSPDGNRTYFGTNYGSGQNQFYVINTQNKSNPTIISSYNTQGMSITAITIIAQDNRAILVGKNGQEYQAINIANESNLSKCGGMDINSGIEDVDTVTDGLGNAFAYLVTNDNSAEYKILRGGPGGGANGTGYVSNGGYISPVINSQSTAPTYYTFEGIAQIPANTTLKFQIRAGSTPSLSGPWIGPDGTSSTYFTANQAQPMPVSLNNKQYFQYNSFFTSDTVSSPILEEIRLNYQK